MKVKEIMKKNLITVTPTSFVIEAARQMKEKNVGFLLVVEEGELKGILTDRDITLSVVAEGRTPFQMLVKEIMRPEIVSCSPETDVMEATRLMAEKQVRRLPIIADGEVVGVVSLTDLAHVVGEEIKNLFSLRAVAA